MKARFSMRVRGLLVILLSLLLITEPLTTAPAKLSRVKGLARS